MADMILYAPPDARNTEGVTHSGKLAVLAGLIVTALLESDAGKALLLARQLERHLIEDASNGK